MARQDTLPVISQIKIGDQLYNIRDKQSPEGALHFLGINEGTGSHVVSDGGAQTPIIDGVEVTTLQKGDVVLQLKSGSTGDYQEFVWLGTKWELLGDEGSYVVHGTYTTGLSYTGITVGAPTFTGTTETITLNGTISGGNLPVEETDDTSIDPITFTATAPSATVTVPAETFTGTTATVTVKASYQPKGTNSAPTVSATASEHSHGVEVDMNYTPQHGGGFIQGEYQPSGTISAHSVTDKTISVSSFNIPDYITISTSSTGNYQPKGTISKPNITLTPTTITVVTGVTAASGTTTTIYAPATTSITNEILELIATTVVTGVSGGTASGTDYAIKTLTAALAAAPTFTGTTVQLGFAQATITPTATFGFSIADHTFDGKIVWFDTTDEEVTITATASAPIFTGTTETITSTGSYQPAGTNSTVSLTLPSHTVSFTKRLIAKMSAASFSASGNYQPKGTNSAPIVYDDGHTHSVGL